MITVENLKDVISSKEFQADLSEMSSYAASIRQERPIVLLLAKHLCKKYKLKMEEAKEPKRKLDLVVNNTVIEFNPDFAFE